MQARGGGVLQNEVAARRAAKGVERLVGHAPLLDDLPALHNLQGVIQPGAAEAAVQA